MPVFFLFRSGLLDSARKLVLKCTRFSEFCPGVTMEVDWKELRGKVVMTSRSEHLGMVRQERL